MESTRIRMINMLGIIVKYEERIHIHVYAFAYKGDVLHLDVIDLHKLTYIMHYNTTSLEYDNII